MDGPVDPAQGVEAALVAVAEFVLGNRYSAIIQRRMEQVVWCNLEELLIPRADCFPRCVMGVHVVVENLDELGYDLVAFERGEEAAVDVDGGFRFFEGAGQRDA